MVILTVEQKISDEQVIDRITKIMEDYDRHEGFGQAICYCLTRRLCDKYKLLLQEKGVKAEVFIGTGEGGGYRQTDSEKQKILKMFDKGKIQVICATKALGRGVHIDCPIRFIFHAVMPTSLSGK
jgi:superfamily II DNA helicase RecQ